MTRKSTAKPEASGLSGEGDLTSQLLAAFRSMLEEGLVGPGEKLPAERTLATKFQVNRASLRQALTALEIMGVLTRRVGAGTYLSPDAKLILSAPMEFLILVDGISFQDLMEARIIVEPEMAARAAQRATFEHLVELRGALKQMEESGHDMARLVASDLQFHEGVARASGNRTCQHMFAVIHQAMLRLISRTTKVEDLRKKVLMHRSIYAAIHQRDAELARQLMREHLEDTLRMVAANARAEAKRRLTGQAQA